MNGKESEGQINMGTEKLWKVCGGGTGKEFCAWSGLAKIQLNLIKKMNFKGEVVLNLNLVL